MVFRPKAVWRFESVMESATPFVRFRGNMELDIGGLISFVVYSTLLRLRSVVNFALVRFVFRRE